MWVGESSYQDRKLRTSERKTYLTYLIENAAKIIDLEGESFTDNLINDK